MGVPEKVDLLNPPRYHSPRRNPRWTQSSRYIRIIILCLAAFGLWQVYGPLPADPYLDLPCQRLPGASDTLVIMKTGVTELEDRLPPHLENTLRCPPNTIIFSDHSEEYQTERRTWQIRDVLANIDPMILDYNPEFALYRRVKEIGRQGLDPTDLTGTRTTSITSSEDKLVVAGWVLDKWKFLPMMNETYHLHPDKKWYVFIESDTYLFWSTTLKYVSTLDHNEPHCLGHRTTHKSPYPFMQGGAGYVLSHEALKRVVNYIQAHREELDRFVEAEWAGDIALGYVLNESGVPLTYSWPIFQPSFFGVVDFGMVLDHRRYWCYPAASFHHMTPETIEDLWSMEQKWLAEEDNPNNPYNFLRLADVFNNVLLPRMRLPRDDWDNRSNILQKDVATIEDCRKTCIEDDLCLQYSFESDILTCKTSRGPKYGEARLAGGIFSEWMFDRVEAWRNSQSSCIGESFLYYGDVDEEL